jgi:hypothetical protein
MCFQVVVLVGCLVICQQLAAVQAVPYPFASPEKSCTLVRSPTKQGECFNEPECNDVCNNINEQKCSTVDRQQCTTVNEQQCQTVNHQQCSTVQERQCNTVNEPQCSTVNKQQCNTVNERQCSTVNEQQCATVNKQQCTTVNEQQCNTVQEQQCEIQFLYSFIKLSIAVMDDFVTLVRFIENKIMILLMPMLKLPKNLVERLIQTFVSWPVCRDLNAASSISLTPFNILLNILRKLYI